MKRLKKYRVLRGMTQREMAKFLGVSPTILCRIEKGHLKPRETLMTRISKALGKSKYYYFYARTGDLK